MWGRAMWGVCWCFKRFEVVFFFLTVETRCSYRVSVMVL